MKKKLFTLLFSLLLLPAIMQAQVPDGFNFQAVIRNEYGALAANQVVTMKISITTDANGNNVIYTENHSARTNSQGLITLGQTFGGKVAQFMTNRFGYAATKYIWASLSKTMASTVAMNSVILFYGGSISATSIYMMYEYPELVKRGI